MLTCGRRIVFFLFVLFSLQTLFAPVVQAGDKEERIRLLQEKMRLLKEQLAVMQEQKLREQPPGEIPWQPILRAGEERPAYRQYAYFLSAQMGQEDLDSVLQQIYYLASRDPLEERGTLFLIPSFQLSAEQQMSVETYNRDFAGQILHQAGVPTAIEGGLLVSAEPLSRARSEGDPLLFIDLAGSDQILRSRIFELLTSHHLFADGGSIESFIWELVLNASPQVFSLYWQDHIAWLALDKN